jgi:hypothetical protein
MVILDLLTRAENKTHGTVNVAMFAAELCMDVSESVTTTFDKCGQSQV